MLFRLAVEDIEPDHWIAYAVDFPGCFSSAATTESAIINAAQKIKAYFSWLSKHDRSWSIEDDAIETQVVETFQSFVSREDPDYIVNAFFESDRLPLDYWDVVITLRLLEWTRQDLMDIVHAANHNGLTCPILSEVHGSIAGIIDHLAVAENWYFNQIGCGLDRSDLCKDPLEKLAQVRANARSQFIQLISDERSTKQFDEQWSARKVVRRTVWHERDHTEHIMRLLNTR